MELKNKKQNEWFILPKSLPWHTVEKAISKEIKWLKETIDAGYSKNRENLCEDCFFRRLAILIIKQIFKHLATQIKDNSPLFFASAAVSRKPTANIIP